jgi:hypothetical protein
VIPVERLDGYFVSAEELFDVFFSEVLNLPESLWFHFQHKVLELATAVKPYTLEMIFHRYRLDRLICLDPDISVKEPFVLTVCTLTPLSSHPSCGVCRAAEWPNGQEPPVSKKRSP